LLELSITERGTVSSVNVVSSSGFADLDAAAARAAERARFSPAKSGRKAVPSTARITISFRLTQR
jgi:protein TonB